MGRVNTMKLKSMRNTKIRTKLMLLGGVSVLGLFILGSESVATAWKINQVGKEMSNVWLNAVITAEELNTLTSDYRILESRHAIEAHEEEMTEIEAALIVVDQSIQGKFREYKNLPTSEADQAMIQRASELWSQYLASSQELLTVSRENSRQDALELLGGTSQRLFDETSELCLQAVEHTKQATDQARAEADLLYQRLSHIKLLVIALDCFVVIYLIIYLTRAIEHPAQALYEAAHRATNGNLELSLDYKSEDEIGSLTEAMNLLIRRLKAIINDQKWMMREICNGNYNVRSECEQSYRGDFATILYSYTCLQSRLKEMSRRHEEEVDSLNAQIEELKEQLAKDGNHAE